MPNHILKKGRGAPLKGDTGPLIGVLKLGLALATIGVLSKLTHKIAGPGPRSNPGFGGSSFAGPGRGMNAGTSCSSMFGRTGLAAAQGPRNFGSGPSTPRPRNP